jgi:hypothetical protein
VFVREKPPRAESPELRAKPPEEIFLNNALLQAGHAERYDGGPKDE